MSAIISAGRPDENFIISARHTDTNSIISAPALIKILTLTETLTPTLTGLRPVRYMTTSGQGVDDFGTIHELHAESACDTSVQEGGPFQYSFWTISVHNESDCKKTQWYFCER